MAAQAQLITGVTILDGSGGPARVGSVRILDGKISETGALQPKAGEIIMEGGGLVLAPGFIDAHSHHWGYLREHPEGLPVVSQGITTIVVGQDGFSDQVDSLETWFQQQPVAVNVATFTGHSSLREEAMGATDVFRTATASELEAMKELLRDDLNKGSLGLSTGLEYEEAFYSSREEVVSLAQVAADAGGRYISHIRSEDITLEDAVEEIIRIGDLTRMPVQLTHIKIGMASKWGEAGQILERLDSARTRGIDITADIYPYDFWNSTLRVLFPKRDYDNLESAEFAVRETFNPGESYLVAFAPVTHYKGMTIEAISQERGETAAETLLALIRLAAEFQEAHPNFEGSVEAIAAKGMSEADIATFMAWEHTGICSDGNAGGHPRGYGAFPRVLARYVRDSHLLSLEEAVHKMTGLTAVNLGIAQKGFIKPGYDADLVLFDPETVQDRASIENPHALANGIKMVWVAGKLVYADQKALDARPGTLIKRTPQQNAH